MRVDTTYVRRRDEMKITVGLDTLERLDEVAGLVAGFRFPQPEVELVHVLERLGRETGQLPDGARPDLITNFLKMQEEEADRLLGDGSSALARHGIRCRTQRLVGFSGNAIVARAAETRADLLALGSSGKGPIGGALLGSVGRKALVSAGCSVLIAKGARPKKEGLTVVFATDHSVYAKRCLETFVAWRPEGVSRAVVATVYPEQLVGAMAAVVGNFKADVTSWVREKLEKENAAAVSSLAKLGIACSSRVETGAAGDSLERVMKEEAADVLVLGAQGRGFMDRVLIGSVSLDQALRRPYSVLVVRSSP
jgi:nucleotide-binding universal stress UspA family protein